MGKVKNGYENEMINFENQLKQLKTDISNLDGKDETCFYNHEIGLRKLNSLIDLLNDISRVGV